MSIQAIMETEIMEKLDCMQDMKPESDEYKKSVGNVMELLDRIIEMDKIDADREERKQIREAEEAFKKESAKEDRLNRIVDRVLTASGIIIPAALTVWGTKKTLKFEETGTVTTIMGRGFINKLLPKK